MAFSEVILAYAGLTSKKNKKMLKIISKNYSNENSKVSPGGVASLDRNGALYRWTDFFHHQGISYKDYEDFFEVLRSIHDIDTALKFYSLAGAPIDKSKRQAC